MAEKDNRDSDTYVDSRTGLPGREEFYRDVGPLLETCESLVLLDIEIDGLDFILYTFGPEERDRAVHEIGDRISKVANCTVPYHITQERFALILNDYDSGQAVAQAERLLGVLKQPVGVSGIPYQMEPYLGISHFPNHADSINELVRTAVFACYQARQNQDRFSTFNSEADQRERYKFNLLTDLKQALDTRNGITLAYQPQLDFREGEFCGVEGLFRWHHDQRGTIPPGEFMPYVEQSSLMLQLTEIALGLGLNDISALFTDASPGSLAINLSTALFRQHELLEKLQEQFRFHNINPGRVHFEITETDIMDQPNHAINVLETLRNWGCSIAVDDFGTGHSSLAYLADLPIDAIKIDQHFIHNLANPGGESIIGATATLADKLGLTTIAEGIETEEQYRKCRELGVTIGQGYYFAYPMARDDCRKWLEAYEAGECRGH